MLDKVKIILKISNTESDEVITLFLNRVINKIKIYCNISDLPPELSDTVVEIVINEYGNEIKKIIGIEEDKDVASIKRGDMQINYATDKINQGGSSFLSDYRLLLDPFRKLKIPK